jgi:hypothetical protein
MNGFWINIQTWDLHNKICVTASQIYSQNGFSTNKEFENTLICISSKPSWLLKSTSMSSQHSDQLYFEGIKARRSMTWLYIGLCGVSWQDVMKWEAVAAYFRLRSQHLPAGIEENHNEHLEVQRVSRSSVKPRPSWMWRRRATTSPHSW